MENYRTFKEKWEHENSDNIFLWYTLMTFYHICLISFFLYSYNWILGFETKFDWASLYIIFFYIYIVSRVTPMRNNVPLAIDRFFYILYSNRKNFKTPTEHKFKRRIIRRDNKYYIPQYAYYNLLENWKSFYFYNGTTLRNDVQEVSFDNEYNAEQFLKDFLDIGYVNEYLIREHSVLRYHLDKEKKKTEEEKLKVIKIIE